MRKLVESLRCIIVYRAVTKRLFLLMIRGMDIMVADVNGVRLKEYQPCPQVEGWRRHVSAFAVRVAFAILAMGLWCLSVGFGFPMLQSAVGAVIVFLVGWYLSSLEPSQAVRLRPGVFPRIIALDGDTLGIRTPSGEEQFSLRDSCWYLGVTSDDPILNAGQYRRPAPIIVLPNGRVIACGIQAGYMERWLEALQLAGCPRVMRPGGVVGLAGAFILGMTVVAGLVGGILVGTWVGSQLPLPNGLEVKIFRASGAVLGAFSAFMPAWLLTPGLYRPIAAHRGRLYRFAALLPALIVLSRLRWVGLPLRAGIPFALVWGSILVLVTVWLTSRRNRILRSRKRTKQKPGEAETGTGTLIDGRR